jgi:hypothetical protein
MSHRDSAPFEDVLEDLRRISRARSADGVFEAVRADPEPQGRWLLSFEGGGIQVDMELAENGGRLRLIGQISGDSGELHFLESAGGRQRLEVDPIGRFLIDGVAHGPMRLRCQSSCGLPVTTVWVTI